MTLPPLPSTDYVPFSDRYGLNGEVRVLGREHWTGRHADHGIVSFGCCPPDARRVCACPGSGGKRQCCEVATAEDLLCDACREHCWAVDSAKAYHRLIDLYVAVANERGSEHDAAVVRGDRASLGRRRRQGHRPVQHGGRRNGVPRQVGLELGLRPAGVTARRVARSAASQPADNAQQATS